MRDGGIVLFNTSVMQGQTVNIDHNNTLYATGKRNKLAHFRVHKVDENGIRMFESMVYPKQFIRIKDGQVDINVSSIPSLAHLLALSYSYQMSDNVGLHLTHYFRAKVMNSAISAWIE